MLCGHDLGMALDQGIYLAMEPWPRGRMEMGRRKHIRAKMRVLVNAIEQKRRTVEWGCRRRRGATRTVWIRGVLSVVAIAAVL